MVPPPSSATAPPRTPSRDAGSELARRLFEDHQRDLLRFLRRRDPDLAEDALSETFAVAVRRADDIPAGRELPWLYVVAEHVLRNLQRSRRRAARIPEALQPFTRHSADAAAVPYVGEALGELPDRERILLTMTAFEGLSATEAADLMGIPYGSARNALSSGRKRLAVVLASAAAVVLLAGLVAAVAGSIRERGEQPLQTLASTISKARFVHDVAIVRRSRGSADTSTTGQPPRYERWSDQAGDRTRVRLPGGSVVVASEGQTLRSAAGPATASTPPARRRAIREDLGALDAASPAAIAALLADPAAQRTAADGPRIGGHDTTTLRGRIVDAAGTEHAVRVFVSRDEPTVLRVRVRPISKGTGQVATVDFVAWSAVPQSASPASTTPEIPAQTTPATATAPQGGATASSPSQGRAPAPAPAPSGHDAGDSGRHRQPEPRSVSSHGTAPIVHVRSTVQRCWSGAGNNGCSDLGDREVWVELGGSQRSRVRTRRPVGGPVRVESWSTPQERRSYSVSKNGAQAYGTVHRFARPQTTAPLPDEWLGEWQAALAPVVAELQGQPDALSALAPGPDVGGRPSRVRLATIPREGGTPLSAEIVADASTGEPLTITISSEHPGDGEAIRQTTVLMIADWEQLPSGPHAELLTSRIPEGARLSNE